MGNLLSALRTFATSSARASDVPQDQSKLGKQLKSRAEASIRRIVDKVTKEAKARMEGKAGGEGKSKRSCCIRTLPRRLMGKGPILRKLSLLCLSLAWLELVFWSIRELPKPWRKTIRVSIIPVLVMY